MEYIQWRMTDILYTNKESIVDVLNDIEEFIERMDTFIKHNDMYHYDVSIKKLINNPLQWEGELKIYKNDITVF